MIKTAIAICSAVFALSPSLALVRPISAQEEIPTECETRYSADFQGGIYQGNIMRTVNYSSRNIDYYESPYKAPRFISDFSNACTVNAGGVAIVYNDRVYGNLIPNYAPRYIGSRFSYGTQSSYVNDMFSSLYTLMGTTAEGTTVDGFKSGMTAYVNQKGYSISLPQSTGSYFNVNYEYLKSQLRQDKVAVMFVHGFSTVSTGDIKSYGSYDTIDHKLYNGYHTVMVYGYRDYYYYDSNGNLMQTDSYLCVQNCYENTALEYFSMNYYCDIDDIYIVDIY